MKKEILIVKKIFDRICENEGDNLNPMLREHEKEMAPFKEIFTKEIEEFTKQYDSIGEMTIKEEPDIATMDYIYSFKKLNDATEEEYDNILNNKQTYEKIL